MRRMQNQPTFIFYDYETFGADPMRDRAAQFACVRTDTDFNLLADPQMFYCRPADDYLPQPEAVLITGITPQLAMQRGLCEADFAARIHGLFAHPGTCVVGYNNVRFDDEFTRHLFYRNFYDPYAWCWQQGNSRWDLLDVVRTCHALRPEGINWPKDSEDLPSFKLEALTAANNIAHQHAHDALADVYATIAVAKLIQARQPRLLHFLLRHRTKQALISLIDMRARQPLVHVSGMFGAKRSNISLIAPLAWHPENHNALICCDLTADLSPLLTLQGEALRQRLFTPRAALQGELPIPIKLVHINKCPVLAPAAALRAEDALRLNIDLARCSANLQLLHNNPHLRSNAVEIFTDSPPFTQQDDVDNQLYQGFFTEADRAAMIVIRQAKPEHLSALSITFADKRLAALLFRYRARNYPLTLDDAEQQRWLQHRRDKLTQERLSIWWQQLENLFAQYAAQPKKRQLLHALLNYGQQLVG